MEVSEFYLRRKEKKRANTRRMVATAVEIMENGVSSGEKTETGSCNVFVRLFLANGNAKPPPPDPKYEVPEGV